MVNSISGSYVSSSGPFPSHLTLSNHLPFVRTSSSSVRTNGRCLLRVRWKGHGPDEDTYVPEIEFTVLLCNEINLSTMYSTDAYLLLKSSLAGDIWSRSCDILCLIPCLFLNLTVSLLSFKTLYGPWNLGLNLFAGIMGRENLPISNSYSNSRIFDEFEFWKWRENSPNSNSETEIRHSEFEFESNPASKIREYSLQIRIRIMIVLDFILVTKTPTRKTQLGDEKTSTYIVGWIKDISRRNCRPYISGHPDVV
jgi:hypothetical protein